MKLYATPPSPRAFKVLAVLNHLGLEAELCPVDLAGGEQMRPAFLALNPNHRVPVLEDDGFVLWESNAIMQYLAAKKPEAGLWPAGARQQADVSRWQCWELGHWDRACSTLLFERFVKKLVGGGDPEPREVERGERELRELAQVLDDHLRGRDWLAGNRLTLADLSIGAWLTCAQLGAFPLEGRREIARWYEGLAALPAWQRSLAAPAVAAAGA
ncbi:MAG: glutathione S-transferase family protein [Thermodesulfobacteriota bacterium]